MRRFSMIACSLLLLLLCIPAYCGAPFPLMALKSGGSRTEFSYEAGDVKYIFGEQGEGLKRVEKNDATNKIIYDFGDRPAWFMLKSFAQAIESGTNDLLGCAMYRYPNLDASDQDRYNYVG